MKDCHSPAPSLPPFLSPPSLSLSHRGSACRLSSRAPIAPPSCPIPFLHDIICTSVVPTGCWWHRQATKLVELSLYAFVTISFFLFWLSVSCCWSFFLFPSSRYFFLPSYYRCFSFCLSFPAHLFLFFQPLFTAALCPVNNMVAYYITSPLFPTVWHVHLRRQETAIKLNDPWTWPQLWPVWLWANSISKVSTNMMWLNKSFFFSYYDLNY